MLGTLLQGEFFGELALITNERRSATICAGGDTTLDVFTLLKHDFETVVSTFPKLNEMVRLLLIPFSATYAVRPRT